MLVLTRKANEQIQIGDHVVITILQVKGQSVRIGIEAPREIRVLRSELPRTENEPMETQSIESAPRPRRAKTPRIHGESQRAMLANSPLLARAAPLAMRVEHRRIPRPDRVQPPDLANRVATLTREITRPLTAAAPPNRLPAAWAYDSCGL
jgi:carbon storage regulator CsrA